MPAHAFDYAIVRLVPRIDLGERINAGVIVYSPTARFLGARVRLHPSRLAVFAPEVDPELVARHLSAWVGLAHGDPTAGPLAALPAGERFHWLVSPRSTMIQASSVHNGIAADPKREVDRLFAALVPA